jgi:hypothetical protein
MKRFMLPMPVLALVVLVSACGSNDPEGASTTTSPATLPTSKPSTVWQSAVMQCQSLDTNSFPVRQATAVTEDELRASDCVAREGNVMPSGLLVVVPSGKDRLDMFVGDTSTRSNLDVSISAPDSDCVSTMEWRGDMVLVVGSTSADPTAATLKVSDVQALC